MTLQTRRTLLIGSLGAIIAILVVYGFFPKPVRVDEVKASRGMLRVTVEEEGSTQVKDRFVVSAPVSGHLRRIKLEVGDTVLKGARVAELDPLGSAALDPRSRAEAEAAVASARAGLAAALEKARAAAADAQYTRERYGRYTDLFKGGFISKDELAQAESESKKAEAMRLSADAFSTAARADLERIQSVLNYNAVETGAAKGETVIVRAPVSGKVLKVQHESEGVVISGEPLVSIGNPEMLEVKIEVLSSDAVKLGPGTVVLFERWGGDKPLEGRVRVVEPSGFTKVSSLGVEEQRVNVLVDLTTPYEVWQRLGDGYRLDASFIVWEGKDVLQVPASALFRKGDGWELFGIENDRARLTQVQVGRRNGMHAEILSGLSEGDGVIAHPDDSVKDGIRVKPR